MAKHTLGPWEPCFDEDAEMWSVVAPREGWRTVAPEGVRESDARLIAAAPEMAEWLREGTGKHRDHCNGFPASEEAWADCDCGLAALLRKAGVLP